MRFQIFKFGIVMAGAAASLNAQWLNYPEPGTPLTLDGKPDLVAKTPRASNGRPDLSGVWQIEPPAPGEIERLYGKSEVSYVAGDDVRDVSRYFANLFIDFKPGEEPIMPAAAVQTLRNRQKRNLLDNPTAHCLPYGLPNRYFAARPFKILQTPEAVAMFFEVDGAFRQIHTDGANFRWIRSRRGSDIRQARGPATLWSWRQRDSTTGPGWMPVGIRTAKH